MGRKITTAISMMPSVRWLLDASQTVKLLPGCDEDGNRNGKRLTPIEPMTPAIPLLLIINTVKRRRAPASAATSRGAINPTIGRSIAGGQRL